MGVNKSVAVPNSHTSLRPGNCLKGGWGVVTLLSVQLEPCWQVWSSVSTGPSLAGPSVDPPGQERTHGESPEEGSGETPETQLVRWM